MLDNKRWRELKIITDSPRIRTVIAEIKAYGPEDLELSIPAKFNGIAHDRDRAKKDNGYDAFELPKGTLYRQICFVDKYGSKRYIVSPDDPRFNKLIFPPVMVKLPRNLLAE